MNWSTYITKSDKKTLRAHALFPKDDLEQVVYFGKTIVPPQHNHEKVTIVF